MCDVNYYGGPPMSMRVRIYHTGFVLQFSVTFGFFYYLQSSIFTFKGYFPMFHFFTLMTGILLLFTLVTLNMVSPPIIKQEADGIGEI